MSNFKLEVLRKRVKSYLGDLAFHELMNENDEGKLIIKTRQDMMNAIIAEIDTLVKVDLNKQS